MKRAFTPLVRLAVLATAWLAVSGSALAGHPKIDAAIQNLLAARAELQKANVSAGGKRQAAIAAIDRALAEARADVDFRDNKPRKKKGR